MAALAAALLALGPAGPARAEPPEEKGRAIPEEMDRRDLGFGNSAAELKMVLSNKEGETRHPRAAHPDPGGAGAKRATSR